MNDLKIEASMQIILNAGDARLSAKKAMDSLIAGDMEASKELLDQAKDEITIAHKIQTDAIQDEANGEESEYSLLFAHAQDTLMTIYSELNIYKQLFEMYNALDKRILKLEESNEKS